MIGVYPAYDMDRWNAGQAAIKLANEILAIDPGATIFAGKLRAWGESELKAAHFTTLAQAKDHFDPKPTAPVPEETTAEPGKGFDPMAHIRALAEEINSKMHRG